MYIIYCTCEYLILTYIFPCVVCAISYLWNCITASAFWVTIHYQQCIMGSYYTRHFMRWLLLLFVVLSVKCSLYCHWLHFSPSF